MRDILATYFASNATLELYSTLLIATIYAAVVYIYNAKNDMLVHFWIYFVGVTLLAHILLKLLHIFIDMLETHMKGKYGIK